MREGEDVSSGHQVAAAEEEIPKAPPTGCCSWLTKSGAVMPRLSVSLKPLPSRTDGQSAAAKTVSFFLIHFFICDDGGAKTRRSARMSSVLVRQP